jgi:hypothetical protein
MGILGKLRTELRRHRRTAESVEQIQRALARIELRQMLSTPIRELRDAELKVFSQFGEDGILQYLLGKVPVARRVFVEFGVSDYDESNTRFLLQNDNWSGLVMDGSARNIEFIKSREYYWRHNLKAECAFITRDNINSLLAAAGISGEIGVLSIDVDGNDYWIWEAIDQVQAAVVVCEYNGLFGWSKKLTVPYDPGFRRDAAHYSGIYYGASIAALADLGARKGYILVGSNSAGNNLFFVRRDTAGDLSPLAARAAHVEAQFREARGRDGTLLHLSRQQMLDLIGDLPLHDVDSGQIGAVRDLCRTE